jgi:hypothetical protein
MPTFTQIGSAQVVGSGGATSIDFTAIPATFTDLCLKISARTAGNNRTGILTINNDTTDANYSRRDLYGTGSDPFSGSGSDRYVWYLDFASDTASTFGNTEFYFSNYANTTLNKSFSVDSIEENNATLAYAFLIAGRWNNTNAINRLTLTNFNGNYVEHSTAYLYGISNA